MIGGRGVSVPGNDCREMAMQLSVKCKEDCPNDEIEWTVEGELETDGTNVKVNSRGKFEGIGAVEDLIETIGGVIRDLATIFQGGNKPAGGDDPAPDPGDDTVAGGDTTPGGGEEPPGGTEETPSGGETEEESSDGRAAGAGWHAQETGSLQARVPRAIRGLSLDVKSDQVIRFRGHALKVPKGVYTAKGGRLTLKVTRI